MLTDAAIRRLKPRGKPFKVGDMHGLYLLVRLDGARYWWMDYRHAGKRGTVALGIYPQVSLKEAREKRAGARKIIDKGINPSAYRKLTRGVSTIGAGDTFNGFGAEWLGKVESGGPADSPLVQQRW